MCIIPYPGRGSGHGAESESRNIVESGKKVLFCNTSDV